MRRTISTTIPMKDTHGNLLSIKIIQKLAIITTEIVIVTIISTESTIECINGKYQTSFLCKYNVI